MQDYVLAVTPCYNGMYDLWGRASLGGFGTLKAPTTPNHLGPDLPYATVPHSLRLNSIDIASPNAYNNLLMNYSVTATSFQASDVFAFEQYSPER
jgi:hypothetical protein